MWKRILLLIAVATVVVGTIAACSAAKRVENGETVNLGPLPSDIQIIDGRPQVVSVSIVDDEVLLTYRNRHNLIVAQQYGCVRVGHCGQPEMQGRYVWEMPLQ